MRFLPLIVASTFVPTFAVASETLVVEAPELETDRSALPALVVSAGAALLERRFNYTDDLFGRFRNYRLPLGGGLRLDARFHPGTLLGSSALGAVGLVARAELSAPFMSQTSDGSAFPTTTMHVMGGVEIANRFGPVELAAIGGVGRQTFTLEDASEGKARPAVPSANYTYLKGGARARLALGDFGALRARGAYLKLFRIGELDDEGWFPRATGAGVDFGGDLVVSPIPDLFSVVFGADVRRFFFSMHPEVGDTNVVGGAVDQYIVIHLSAQLTI